MSANNFAHVADHAGVPIEHAERVTRIASGLGEIMPEVISIGGVSALGWTAGAMLVLGAFRACLGAS